MIEKRSMRVDEKESIRFSRWLHLQFILILLNDINDSDNEERINDNNVGFKVGWKKRSPRWLDFVPTSVPLVYSTFTFFFRFVETFPS